MANRLRRSILHAAPIYIRSRTVPTPIFAHGLVGKKCATRAKSPSRSKVINVQAPIFLKSYGIVRYLRPTKYDSSIIAK